MFLMSDFSLQILIISLRSFLLASKNTAKLDKKGRRIKFERSRNGNNLNMQDSKKPYLLLHPHTFKLQTCDFRIGHPGFEITPAPTVTLCTPERTYSLKCIPPNSIQISFVLISIPIHTHMLPKKVEHPDYAV